MRSIEDFQRQDLWTKDNDFLALARMLLRTKTTGAPWHEARTNAVTDRAPERVQALLIGDELANDLSPAAHTRSTAGIARDGTSGGREHGYLRGEVAAHHDIDVAALLEVRIKDRLTGQAPAQLWYFGESAILH